MTDSTEDTSADTENDSDNEDLENEDSDSEETAQEKSTATKKFETLKEISLEDTEYKEKDIQEFLYDKENFQVLELGNISSALREVKLNNKIFLDLLYEDISKKWRYVIEIQLGQIDADHVFRAIEYWDFVKDDNREFNYCAVVIAENTSRYLNVISYLDKRIPFIVIKMQAYEQKENESLILTFTKILDSKSGYGKKADDDKRIYEKEWKKHRSHKLLESMFEIVKQEVGKKIHLEYTKYYINIGGIGKAFISFLLQQNKIIFRPKLDRSEEKESLIKKHDLQYRYNDNKSRLCYEITVRKEDLDKKRECLKYLIKAAYENRFS